MKVQQIKSDLSTNDLIRYSRQISIPSFGVEAQKALKAATVAVIGAGGLGAPVLQYLAAAGVGRIMLYDDDVIDESNLQRQVLFQETQVGEKKAAVSTAFIKALNSDVEMETHEERIHAANAAEMLKNADLVIDGSDNFLTRYVINDACICLDIPFVFGSVYQFEGQLSVFNYVDKHGNRGPDYRALFPKMPEEGFIPNCAEGGVIGALPGIIGSMQALEAIKIITGTGQVLSGKLLMLDGLSMQFSTIDISGSEASQKPDAKAALQRLKKLDEEYGQNSGMSYCESDANPICEINPPEFEILMDKKNIQVIDVRSHKDRDAFRINALHIPFEELDQRTDEIHPDKVKVVCCNIGQTSRKAIQKLQDQHGMKNLLNLKGGAAALKNHFAHSERTT